MKNVTAIKNSKNKKKELNLKKFLSPLIITLFLVLLIYSISLIIPFVWGILTSLKGKYEIRNNPFGLPQEWLFSNYIDAFDNFKVRVEWGDGFRWVYFEEMFLNSILYSLGCALIQSFTACLVAYVTARFSHFKFSKILYTVVIIVMILPIVGSQPSELALVRSLGIHNTMWGMWIMRLNFLGVYFLVFHAMFKGIPKDYAEAAYMDGASEWQVLTKIMLPMAKNTLLTVILLNFIGYWNDYQTPLLYIPSHPTLAYGLYLFSNSADSELVTIPMKITGCMLMMVPILIIFLIFHKRLIGNISIGGIKE